MGYPLSTTCVTLWLQIYEWSLSGSAPKSLHVVGFTRTKSSAFLSIKWYHITAAYHFGVITIKSPASQPALKEIGVMHDYLPAIGQAR